MKPALLECSWRYAGHQKNWMQALARGFLARGWDTRVFSPSEDPLENDVPGPGRLSIAKMVELRDLLGPWNWIPSDTPRQMYAARHYLRGVRNEWHANPGAFNHVVFNYVDPLLVNVGSIGSRLMEGLPCPWSAFWIWSDPGRSLQAGRPYGRFAQPWKSFEAANLHRLFYLVEQDGDFLNAVTGGKAVWVPDFSANDARDEASPLGCEVERRAGGRPVVLLAGHLTPRKGVLDFLRLAESARTSWDALFVLAGHLDWRSFSRSERAMVRKTLNEQAANLCCFTDRIAGDGEFNDLLSRATVLYAVYRNFRFSSNLLAKAAHFQTPILVPLGGTMGRRVSEFGLGLSCNPEDLGANLAACQHLASTGMPDPDGARRYLAIHSREAFVKTVTQALAP